MQESKYFTITHLEENKSCGTIRASNHENLLDTINKAVSKQLDAEVKSIGILPKDSDFILNGSEMTFLIVTEEDSEQYAVRCKISQTWIYESGPSVESRAEKVFPNGFESWHETHFEVVQAITMIIRQTVVPDGIVNERNEAQGHGGLYELAQELTDKFEKQYESYDWGETEEGFFPVIEEFLKENLQ